MLNSCISQTQEYVFFWRRSYLYSLSHLLERKNLGVTQPLVRIHLRILGGAEVLFCLSQEVEMNFERDTSNWAYLVVLLVVLTR